MKERIAALLLGLAATSYGGVYIDWGVAGAGFYFARNPDVGILGSGTGNSTIAQLMYSPDNVKDDIDPSGTGVVNDVVLASMTITEDGVWESWDYDSYAPCWGEYTGPYTGGYVYAVIFQDDNIQVGDWYFSSPIVAVQNITGAMLPQEIELNADPLNGDAINSGPNARQVVGGGNNFLCTTNSDSTITVTGYTGSGGAVTVPSSINSNIVTRIETNVFYNKASLTSITIPGSITNIGNMAFSTCIALKGVYFQGNAPNIGSNIFSGTTNAIIYRAADAAGWPTVPNAWAGRPTALWDSDADGISDPWEQKYFGGSTNANPNAVCSNGINTVRQAYIAGLNPNDPQSALRVTDLSNGKTLGWNAASGRIYSVYFSTNLMFGFQCLGSNIPWTQASFTNANTVPCGYYKIDVRLAE